MPSLATDSAAHKMEHIERSKLYTDPVYRFQYVANFMDFGDDDVDAIKGAAELIKPLVPTVVDAVYRKLHTFDITWDVMAKRHEGFTPSGSKVIEKSSELSEDADQIKFRKDMLSRYFAKLLENPYDERMIKYLEYVARIHTDTPTKKSKINVDLIHINALLGYVETVLIGGVKSLNLDRDTEYKAITAFGKLLWIQNDFFIKFYCRDGAEYLEDSASANTTAVAVRQPGIFARLWNFFF
ncbi:Protoglobin-domain-containing protein [Dissophora ornata]|nr:Protoglobin-domain-containing protein [Dissophora ornata]